MTQEDFFNTVICGKKKGYRISFERCGDGFLRGDYYPEDALINDKEIAWRIAQLLADRMKGKICNIYVVDETFSTAKDDKDRIIESR